MTNETVRKFRHTLVEANGDEAKMKKVFKNISDYLAASTSEKRSGQSVEDYLRKNPGIRKVHEWSGTVLVNNEYQLINY